LKRLITHKFDPAQCRKEWNQFKNLLETHSTLEERKQILPFFKDRIDLSLLMSGYIPAIKTADVFAHEYVIYGDFAADLVVGDRTAGKYLLIEFENANPEGIFKKKAKKATPDWAPRFEAAFSQLLDWLWKLEDMRSTAAFIHAFGHREAKFYGMIIVGKDMNLDPQETSRLTWRNDRVIVDSHTISCLSFDQLCEDLDFRLANYYNS
jgi:hypothetical protein